MNGWLLSDGAGPPSAECEPDWDEEGSVSCGVHAMCSKVAVHVHACSYYIHVYIYFLVVIRKIHNFQQCILDVGLLKCNSCCIRNHEIGYTNHIVDHKETKVQYTCCCLCRECKRGNLQVRQKDIW